MRVLVPLGLSWIQLYISITLGSGCTKGLLLYFYIFNWIELLKFSQIVIEGEPWGGEAKLRDAWEGSHEKRAVKAEQGS